MEAVGARLNPQLFNLRPGHMLWPGDVMHTVAAQPQTLVTHVPFAVPHQMIQPVSPFGVVTDVVQQALASASHHPWASLLAIAAGAGLVAVAVSFAGASSEKRRQTGQWQRQQHQKS